MKVCNDLEKKHINILYETADVENIKNNSIFSTGILDVFPKKLTENEAKKVEFSELYKFHEYKYLSLFRDIHQRNGASVFVRPFVVISTSNKYMSKKDLNKDEQKFIKELSYYENNLLKIEDTKELDMLVKATTREVILSIFYFETMFIIGNYDLSFPLSALSESLLKDTINYVKRHNLFIRV